MSSTTKKVKLSLFIPIVTIIIIISTAIFILTYKGMSVQGENKVSLNAAERAALQNIQNVEETIVSTMLFPYYDEELSLWGYKNENGQIVVAAKYKDAKDFSQDYAFASIESGLVDYYAIIDIEGNEIGDFKYQDVQMFSEGLAAVKDGELWGFIDATGTKVIASEYSSVGNFSQDYAWVSVDNRFGLINSRGDKVVEPSYDTINDVSEGKVFVSKLDESGNSVNYILELNSSNGQFEPYSIGQSQGTIYSDGLACIKDSDGYKYYKEPGQINLQGPFEGAKNFSENLAAAKKDGKWGYINKGGDFIIKPTFEEANDFSQGWAAVKLGGVWGYIQFSPEEDSKFKLVVDYRFKSAQDLKDGYAIVQINDSICVLDKEKTKGDDLLGSTIALYELPKVQPDSQTLTGKITLTSSNAANVRQKPDKNSAQVATIANGEVVEIISEQDGWYEIKYATFTGFVLKDLVAVQGDIGNINDAAEAEQDDTNIIY